VTIAAWGPSGCQLKPTWSPSSNFVFDSCHIPYAGKFVAFVNKFKAQLGSGLLLTVDVIASNVDGDNCSGNNGYLDLHQLAGSAIDRLIIEDYTSTLGSGSSAGCQPVTLDHNNPAPCDPSFVGQLNLMCSGGFPANKVVVGLQTVSSGTNPIAGQALSALESRGFTKVAVFPSAEGTGDYTYLSSAGLVADKPDWYSLLEQFLAAKNTLNAAVTVGAPSP